MIGTMEADEIALLSTLDGTSHHEAAHAVVAARFGRALGSLLLEEAEHGEWKGVFRSRPRPGETATEDAERLLAGELAARKIVGLPLRIDRTTGHVPGDSDRVLEIAAAQRARNPGHWFKVVEAKARRTVEREWRAIHALGAALGSQKRIDGREVLAIIQEIGLTGTSAAW